jgi:hypothetical protein
MTSLNGNNIINGQQNVQPNSTSAEGSAQNEANKSEEIKGIQWMGIL